MSEYLPFIFPMLLVVFVGVSVAELFVAGLWLPFYFRFGIPLFRQSYPMTYKPDLAAKIPELEQTLKRSMWRPSIVFRPLNNHEIAFRYKFGSRNNPVAGLISLEPAQGRMTITGNLYWTYLFMPLLFLSFPAWGGRMTGLFFLFVIGIMIFTIGLQRYHYSQIAATIVETAVSAGSISEQEAEPVLYKSAPAEPNWYEPEPLKPQSGLTNVEQILIIVLAALIIFAGVAAFLLSGG
jgi:hypothetical protein